MVVVFTSSLTGIDFFLPEKLMKNYILTAISPTQSLEADTAVLGQLSEKTEEIQRAPKPGNISALSAIAKEVSGKKLELENGEVLQLNFDENGNEPFASFTHGMSSNISIGLDDVYQISDAGIYWPLPQHNVVAAKGRWQDEKTFVIHLISLHNMEKLTYSFSFEGGSVDVRLRAYSKEIMHSKGSIH